jgi:phospholipid/cholesterol/gamma-HCH transport system substrate-binding protein
MFPILGTNPPLPEGRPPLRPGVPCETQEPPDLRTQVGPGEQVVAEGMPSTAAARRRYDQAKLRSVRWLRKQLAREGLDDRYRVSAREAAP